MVHQCSSKANPALHTCGPVDRRLGRRHDLRDDPRQRHPSGPAPVPLLHPEAHVLRALRRNDRPGRRRTADNPSNMGFWYQNADLGPFSPCTTRRGTPPIFDTASGVAGQLDQLERDADHGDQPDARRLLYVQVDGGLDHPRRALVGQRHEIVDGQGHDLHRRQHLHRAGRDARYTGEATIVASGTFGMKDDTICATHPGYTGACDFTKTSPGIPQVSARDRRRRRGGSRERAGAGERLRPRARGSSSRARSSRAP